MTPVVILSEAKDLAAKVVSERGEVLRFAQDDKTVDPLLPWYQQFSEAIEEGAHRLAAVTDSILLF